MATLLLAFIAFAAPRKSCDLIELNHHTHYGKVVWSQVIYWDFDHEDARMHATGWYIVQGDDWPEPARGGWRARDTESRLFRESTSAVDPELADRRARER